MLWKSFDEVQSLALLNTLQE